MIAAGLVMFSNSTPLGPRVGGAAGSDPAAPFADHQHPPPTYAQLEAIIDAGQGSTIWRSAHTMLRTAVQTRDLLTTLLGANWWQGVGGSGITTDQALDAVGAALAMLPSFTYDAAANTFTFTLPNDFVTAAMILAGTAAEKAAWRGEIDATRISSGNALADIATANLRDVHIIEGNPAPGTLSFRDIHDAATVLTTANPFDVMMALPVGRDGKQWLRVGTIGGINAAVQAALELKADTADLPALVSAAVDGVLPPFASISPYPAGIAGGRAAADFPAGVSFVFSDKLTRRGITGVTCTIGGAPLALNAATPVANIDATNELQGELLFDFGAGSLPGLVSIVTRNNARSLPGRLTVTFDSGDPFSYDFAWLVQNAAFAVAPPPFVAMAFTADALAIANNDVAVLQTQRITPRAGARIRIRGHCEAASADARNNNDNDRNQRIQVSIWRTGPTLTVPARLITRTYGNSKVPQQSHVEVAPDIEWLEAAPESGELVYTLRAQRLAPNSTAWTVTDRQLIVEEVL